MGTKSKYSKSYLLRMTDELSTNLYRVASEQNMTINALLTSWISKEIQLYDRQKYLTTPEAIALILEATGLKKALIDSLTPNKSDSSEGGKNEL